MKAFKGHTGTAAVACYFVTQTNSMCQCCLLYKQYSIIYVFLEIIISYFEVGSVMFEKFETSTIIPWLLVVQYHHVESLFHEAKGTAKSVTAEQEG